MYLAERGSTTGDYSLSNLASERRSRVLRFSPKPAGDGSPGSWKVDAHEYAIGMPPDFNNANGGVALGYGYLQSGGLDFGACNATVWSTGERLLDPGDPNAEPTLIPGGRRAPGQCVPLVKPQNSRRAMPGSSTITTSREARISVAIWAPSSSLSPVARPRRHRRPSIRRPRRHRRRRSSPARRARPSGRRVPVR